MEEKDRSSWFWSIIEKAQGDERELRKLLEAMHREQIIEFYRALIQAAADLRCPPYLDFLRGVSEDTIADITEYVVSRGRQYYSDVTNQPQRIPTEVSMAAPSFKGIALLVYWKKYAESIPG
jgi:hypothetical protein